MSSESLTIEPLLSVSEREELAHLDFLSGWLGELVDRGLIAADAHAAILVESRGRREAIERHGRYEAAVSRARAVAKTDPRNALRWGERARELDPARPEAWDLVVSLHRDLEEDEQAIARCTEAVQHFPQFQVKLDRLLGEQASRTEARRIKIERMREDECVIDWLSQARQALHDRRDAEAIALCREILAMRPNHVGALAIAAYAYQRMGQLEDAVVFYEVLVELRPSNSVWSQWVRNIRLRQRILLLTGKAPEVSASADPDGDPTTAPGGVGIAEPPPPLSWASFAGEFLEDHWQKLILCLAVLLIVVSSTVGAHLLLGPLLWSPVGKCALAMVATGLFAALGAGLVRWGAARAGQMMLVTTLIVVPIHFMLAGEMNLVMKPTTSGLFVLVVDGLALVGLVRGVSGMLVPRSEARFLTVALLLLSVSSVATARGAPMPWGWQFAAFQAPAVVFLSAVWALGARRWGTSIEAHRQFAAMVLGLLGFAFLACLIRTGGYALRLGPALYAAPVMLGAIACVHAARRLAPYEPDAQRLALFRFGGYVISGLAFALALAEPSFASALHSGNMLAVGLLGFALYAASLRVDRHPAFLYLAIGALVAARLGAHYFLIERIRVIVDLIRQALGYRDFLPWPFLSVLGLVLNTALVLLSVWFRKQWKDDRLARHCQYIGLPVAIAACVYSGFEPLAATICLSGYTVFFSLAVWVFAAPWVTYLAIAALVGAAYFGSTLIAGITTADQALLAVTIAWGCWAVLGVLQRLGAGEEYRSPWFRATRGLSTLAMVAATLSIAVSGPDSIAAAGTFLLAGSLAVLFNHERPRNVWAGLTLVSFVEFTICGLFLLTGGRTHPASDLGLLFASDGLALLGVAEVLRLWDGAATIRSESSPTDGWATARALDTFVSTVPRFVIGLTLIADWLALLGLSLSWVTGLVWLLGSPALLGTTRFVRRTSLVYLGLAQFVAGMLDLAYWPITWGDPGLAVGWLAVMAVLIAMTLWMAGILARRHGLSDFYVEPCWNWSFALTAGVLALAIASRLMVLEAYRFGVVALLLNTLVTMLLARTWRRAELSYSAVFHVVVATYLVLFSVGNNDPAMAYVLGLFAVIEAIVIWVVAFACQRWGDDWTRSCALPLYHSTVALTVLGIPLADRSPVIMVLAALSFLLTVKSLARAEWLYGAVAALGLASYFRWLGVMPLIGVVGFATGAAFGLWAIGVLLQRSKPALCRRLGLRPLDYEYPLFHSSIVVGYIALGLRVLLSLDQAAPWAAHAWFPLSLSLLALVMVRAYPRRECVHASLAFLVWSVVAVVAPSLTSVCFLAVAGMLLALGLLLIERVGRAYEPEVCYRLGVIDAGYASVIRAWASLLFGVATTLTIVVVLGETSSAMVGRGSIGMAFSAADWWTLLATLGLAGAFLVVAGADPEGWGAAEPDLVMIALYWLGVLGLWWLGVESSPLAGIGLATADYYPFITAMAGLATIHFGRRYTDAETWQELSWLGDVRSERSSRLMSYQACILSVLGVVFTGGVVATTTVVTMTLAAVSLGFGALGLGSPLAAGMGSVVWAAAWLISGLLVARGLGFPGFELKGTCGALGAIGAAFLLWALAGRLRSGGSILKSQARRDSQSVLSLCQRLAVVMEGIASATALLAAAIVLVAGSNAGALGSWGTYTGVGVLMAAAVLHIVLVPRWEAEWLVYLAQGLMVGAYLDFRMAFPLPMAGDAAILTLLGYLDLAIAEVLERLPAGIYARPTRHFSLVLPLLPLIQLLGSGARDGVSLFYLMAAATFYGVTCAQMRWKSLGYAAAVFCNAALWVSWSRLGWMLADHPQFFLVPVGLSAILFAEVNRELGRSAVNTIRSVGLIIIYVSLAVPIWRFESFGAWLTLLLGSLVGVFVGIGLRLQTFLWLGLTTFVLDVVYEMGRVSIDYAFAKWAIMLTLGIALVLFVAVNEKKRIIASMRDYYEQVRLWE